MFVSLDVPEILGGPKGHVT